ncbi:MAG TPA: hypothetical protein VNG69_02270 [Casimicrobiaceae bacterium]|nr:hypothetical protein [Casimicrobiaceae bacterium]
MQIDGRFRARTLDLGHSHARLDRSHYAFGDSILQVKNILEVALEPVRPDVYPGFGLDQLACDAHPIARSAKAALEHIANTELATDLFYIDHFVLIGEAGRACDDEECAHSRKCSDDVVDDAVGEVFLLRIAAQVRKGQHCDRRFVVGSGLRCSKQWKCVRQIGMSELKDFLLVAEIFQAMFAQGLEGCSDGKSVTTQVLRRRRKQRLAAVASAQKARHVVQRRAEVIVVAQFCVARVERHPDADRGRLGPSFGLKRSLCVKGAIHSVARVGECCAERIASCLEDVAVMRLDASVQDLVMPD